MGSNFLLGVYGLCGGAALLPLLLALWLRFLSSQVASGELWLQDQLVRRPASGCTSALFHSSWLLVSLCFALTGACFPGVETLARMGSRGESGPARHEKEATSGSQE